jgi:hypothetical protein
LEASFFKRFEQRFQATFNMGVVSANASLFIRERIGLTIDECARLCLSEPAFQCETLSYEPVLRECKWSSLTALDIAASNVPLITFLAEVQFFISLKKKNFL